MRNKRLTLADAMRTLKVTIKDDGFELKSFAGKAFYGASGLRGKVEGIPEYFPISFSVWDESTPVEPKAELSKVLPGLDEQVAAQAAQISNLGSSITKLTTDLAETNASITQKSTSCVGAMTSLPFSVPASSVNEQHIDSARINKGSISEAHICGNTIEQETLSGVLTNTLHHVNPKEAGDVAKQLAKAVKSAFSVLEHASGEQDKEQPKEPNLSVGAFKIYHEGEVKVAVGPLSTDEIEAERKARKTAGTLNLKLELDTSEAKERLDEFRTLISKAVNSVITDALKPGGKLREAINQKADVSGLQSLSGRVSNLEACLVNQGNQIAELRSAYASSR
ncbi:hypothetical protein GW952_11920 [Klebsiella michiganensis]|uniref:Uncharacterized protein n=1 Tax=Klebsiella michiganensis TaxID=1134687 RepID=A0A6P1UWC8_9ENTR|nr:hypothetical protein [Klebsiella michiganensis]QHS46250.1 hypothetical protein GW952_11920 [Klebsiella michiganensis]HDX8940057.1 hypothetical protein [Klebsiella michiganensis]